MSQAAQHFHDEDPTLASLAPAADGTPALIAGRYEVRDSIGRGAFGEVFEAYDRVLGRLVAVKVMPIAPNLGAEGRESLRRFQVEARAVSRLTHPNIITVHDFGQGERFAWIVMELVIGETLADALRRTGPPPLAETSRILCALLSALHAAHERGIVHRDVKPGNILLEMNLEDGLGEVRLSDFGIARTEAEDRTAVGQMIGTPWVMAPEQLRGEAVDRRTDLWAAGVILYDMLTGERPFKGTMPGIFHRIQHEEPPPPTRLRAELPPAVDALVARALAKAPEDRFATAEEMAAAIRAALTETPRWQDAPPLPGLDAEEPAPRALVPASPPPLPAPPAAPRGRFGQGLAVGMVAGIALGVGASRVAEMSAAVAVLVGPPPAEALAGASVAAAASPASTPDTPRDLAAAAPRATPAPAAWMPEPAEAIRAAPHPAETPRPGATAGTIAMLDAPVGGARVAPVVPPDRASAPTASDVVGGGSLAVLPVTSPAAPRAQGLLPQPVEAPAPPPSDLGAHDSAPAREGAPGGIAATRDAAVPFDGMTRAVPRAQDEAAQGATPSGSVDQAAGPATLDGGALPHARATGDGHAATEATPAPGHGPTAAADAQAGPRPNAGIAHGEPTTSRAATIRHTPALTAAAPQPRPATPDTRVPPQVATPPIIETPRAVEATPALAVMPPPSTLAAATASPPPAAPAPTEAAIAPPVQDSEQGRGAAPADPPQARASSTRAVAVPASHAAGAPPPIAATAAAPPGSLPACGTDRLRIRTGSHDGHGRIVFDWSGPVAYRITPGTEGLGIAFPDAGCQPTTNGIRPARNLRAVEPAGPGAALMLRVAPGAQPRDFRLGNRVVIDLADAAR